MTRGDCLRACPRGPNGSIPRAHRLAPHGIRGIRGMGVWVGSRPRLPGSQGGYRRRSTEREEEIQHSGSWVAPLQDKPLPPPGRSGLPEGIISQGAYTSTPGFWYVRKVMLIQKLS